MKDITGQKYNRLTVIGPTDQRTKDQSILWLCRCDCGGEALATGSCLKRSMVKSCGCLRREMARAISPRGAAVRTASRQSLEGRTFGELTAISYSNGRWLCRCSCGREVYATVTALTKGNTVSCGHLKSERNRACIRANRLGTLDGTNASVLRSIISGKQYVNNTSGATGVQARYRKDGSMFWTAYIQVNRQPKYLGLFNSFEEAVAARKAAEAEFYRPLVDKWEKSIADI